MSLFVANGGDINTAFQTAIENILLGNSYPRGGFSSLSGTERLSGRDMNDPYYTADVIRRTNLMAQLVNSQVDARRMIHAELHPKVNTKGEYHKDFQKPMKLDYFCSIPYDILEDILLHYDLVVFDRTRVLPFGDEYQARLLVLFEFLGADLRGSGPLVGGTPLCGRKSSLRNLRDYPYKSLPFTR